MDFSPDMLATIEAFEPIARPAPNALAGWTVAIRPAGGGSADPTVRRADDIALLTAAVLYHLVQWAGGTPVMTRADDQPERPELLAQTGAVDVVVAIMGTRTSARDAAAHGDYVVATDIAGNSAKLARALGAAFAVEHEEMGGEPLTEAPTAEIVLCVARTSERSSCPPTLPREIAVKICAGLVEYAHAEPALAQARGGTQPGPLPRFIDRSDEAEIAATARRLWPTGNLPAKRIGWFCDLWCSVALSDRSFVHFRPKVERDGKRIVVRGATNVAGMRDTLIRALQAVGVNDVMSQMRVLPEEGRLEGSRWGACISATALTYAEPAENAGLRTQLHYGEPLWLLDRDAGFLLVHATDGYWGWVREEAVRILGEAEFEQYSTASRAILVHDVELEGTRILRGAALPFEFSINGRVTLTGPDGERFEVSAHDVRAFDTRGDTEERIERALALLHRPYVFGGVSPLGLDCSGMAQMLLEQTGVHLPRDAAQQFASGRLVATRWHRGLIQRGDLLYFINPCGRIFHVGLALSPTHFVHSGPPEVKIDSLDPGDRLYAPGRDRAFLAARRW